MKDELILSALQEFTSWRKSLPSLTDMTSLDYSFENGHITEKEYKEGEHANNNQIELIKQKFSELEIYFDIDLPFYFPFLERLKNLGNGIKESEAGFTKALISDVLKSISNKESREKEKIWIFLRLGEFLNEFPDLKT